jgi:DNA-binding transcriptional ArsR family regulator
MASPNVQDEPAAQIRFAFSPIWELGMSLMKPMRDPSKHALHLPWVREARTAIEGRDLALLFSLFAGRDYIPDFLTPSPQTPFPELDEELERMLQTPPDVVRAHLATLRSSAGTLGELAEELDGDPSGLMPRLAEQMREFWKLTIEPHWPTIRAVGEHDVMYRARQLALGGPELLFEDLHPKVSWRDGAIHIEKQCSFVLDPQGRSVVLVPAVFAWPGTAVLEDRSLSPSLAYSPRGIATLWEPEPPRARGAMDDLIGGTRADILRALDAPMTTTELARRLHLTPAAVSQQLGVLRRSGVVEADRVGRGVYSRLTPLGRSLLDLLG